MTTCAPMNFRSRSCWLFGVAAVVVVLAVTYWHAQEAKGARLLLTEPALILKDAELVAFASTRAAPLYRKYCAKCHGADFKGDRSRGAMNLVAATWVYSNSVVDVERTITYGIRSGHPKARNVTDMPAEGRTGQLTAAEIADVVEYVLYISGQQNDAQAASRGRALFDDKGNCFECHAHDGHGIVDYGAPSLVGHDWIYGGDRQTLIDTITNGRHGLCPAWVNTLSPVDLRAMAVYLLTLGTRS